MQIVMLADTLAAQVKAKRANGSLERGRRAELQLLLDEKGIVGYVLPRQMHGTLERPAQGWYVKLEDGRVEFLGDYATLAVLRMDLLEMPARRNGRRKAHA